MANAADDIANDMANDMVNEMANDMPNMELTNNILQLSAHLLWRSQVYV